MEETQTALPQGAESTAPAESQAATTQTTSTVPEANTSAQQSQPSTEDVQNQVDPKENELVEGALETVKSERGQNRVQELANVVSTRTKELGVANSRIQELQTQIQQVTQAGTSGADEAEGLKQQVAIVQARQFIQDSEMAQQRDDAEFEKARSKFPELNPESDQYSREFEDAVYALKKAQGTSYTDGAQMLAKLKSGAETVGYSKAEEEIGLKTSTSATPGVRNVTQVTAQDNEAQKQREQFKKSGSIDDLSKIVNW